MHFYMSASFSFVRGIAGAQMEDCDDGIGSETNSPRHTEGLHENPIMENESVNEMDDLVVSYPSPLVFPTSSTPLRPPTQQICQRVPRISPIERIRSAEFIKSDSKSVLDSSQGEESNAVFSDKHYTKLDLAVMLREKHLECADLEGENERLMQLVEKLENENYYFQNQVSIAKDNAAALAKETEKFKNAAEENEANFMECQHHLRMVERKLAVLENISIDIETDKIPDAETLKKLHDDNMAMREKISELKFEVGLREEAEKNAEIWRKKCDGVEKDMDAINRIKTELEKQLENRGAEIDILNKEKQSCEEKYNKLKNSYDENAAELEELQKQLHVIKEKYRQEQDSKLVGLVQKLEMEKKVWVDEREHLEKEKSVLEKRIEQLTLANDALLSEKQALLKADNNDRKDLAACQEKNEKLTLQNAQLADELEKYRGMDARLEKCLDELTKKDSLIEELNGRFMQSNDSLKKFRDETIYLRRQLSEKAGSKKGSERDWALENKKSLSECEILKEAVTKNQSLMDQIATEKQKNDDLTSLLKEREAELINTRILVDIKGKHIEHLLEEKADLKYENIHLMTVANEVTAKYDTFRNQAEIQYQLETAQLNQIIEEKDERLERLHTRIAFFESYPGHSSICSANANKCIDITIWDALPVDIRLQLCELKKKYQELNAIVYRMMSDPPTTQYANIMKVVENKSTDCCGLASELKSRSDSHIAVCEAGSSIESSLESLTDTPNSKGINETDTLLLILEAVRHAEIRGKLSPNIQQLLEHLLSDIQGGNKSVEQVGEAVSRFFANLDLALRKTLSASDDNRIKCEKLDKLCAEMTSELHEARDELCSALKKCSIYEENIDSLKLQFRCKSAELHGKLKRAFEEVDSLTKQNDILTIAVREAKAMLKRKTDLCLQVPSTIKCIKDELEKAKKDESKMNERLRELCREKEKVKQLLSERELDVVKLEYRLVESTNECTVRASELQHAESKIDELQKRNEYLKRKYDKREGFLEEMEAILRAMKVRCEGLQGTNRLRQHLIEKLKKLLVKLGFNLDNPRLINSRRPIVHEGNAVKLIRKSKMQMQPSHLGRLKIAKIAQRLEKETAKIEELERCQGSDFVHIPFWRSLNAVSVSFAGSRTEKM
ncbi:unnamed protein product [Litomosoides sigmodontis]|uniref:Uncharacterized protein n=1 Tax=Litomosoides sigmodontis TaxID=42156 RepID=A0A3P6SXQ4_LITSI|nr:unnamed protein product [Litomosoides sigmodontis]